MADKRRVCLDCGTPKMPQREKCQPCGKVTLTHVGEARQSICRRCRFIVAEENGKFDCGWARNNNPIVPHRMLDGVLDLTVDYYYACPDFRQSNRASSKASPNPLTFAEQIDIRAFLTLGAFWLDPYLWEDVDSHRDDVWAKQAKRIGSNAKVLTIAAVATATIWLTTMLFSKPKPESVEIEPVQVETAA